jgi:acetolactate synthase I/II/III large subunit
VTGIAQAWVDSTPVLFITGQSKVSDTVRGRPELTGIRQVGTFEVDIVSIVKPITKYAQFVTEVDFMKDYLDLAVNEATSKRPGPVLLDIPLNIQGAPWKA